MRNIDLFNLHVAEVLGTCYENFPVRIDFKYDDLAYRVFKQYSSGTDEELFFNAVEYSELAVATLDWLTEAGYLWVSKKVHGSVKGVTLTPKSLELLNATPESIESKTSIGTALANESKKLGRETVLSIVQTVLAEGAKFTLMGQI